jgi:hypothetical protein
VYHVCICLKAPSRPISVLPPNFESGQAFAELDQAAPLQPETICKNCPVRTVTAVNCEGSGKNLKYRRYSLCTSRQPVALSFLPEAIGPPDHSGRAWGELLHLSRWSPVSTAKTQVLGEEVSTFKGMVPPGRGSISSVDKPELQPSGANIPVRSAFQPSCTSSPPTVPDSTA